MAGLGLCIRSAISQHPERPQPGRRFKAILFQRSNISWFCSVVSRFVAETIWQVHILNLILPVVAKDISKPIIYLGSEMNAKFVFLQKMVDDNSLHFILNHWN